MEIDSTKCDATKLAALEAVLYGTSVADAVYAVTSDTSKQAGKTYYTKSGSTYTEFSGESFASGTTYYEITSPAVAEDTTAHLPMPDEVIALLSGT